MTNRNCARMLVGKSFHRRNAKARALNSEFDKCLTESSGKQLPVLIFVRGFLVRSSIVHSSFSLVSILFFLSLSTSFPRFLRVGFPSVPFPVHYLSRSDQINNGHRKLWKHVTWKNGNILWNNCGILDLRRFSLGESGRARAWYLPSFGLPVEDDQADFFRFSKELVKQAFAHPGFVHYQLFNLHFRQEIFAD